MDRKVKDWTKDLVPRVSQAIKGHNVIDLISLKPIEEAKNEEEMYLRKSNTDFVLMNDGLNRDWYSANGKSVGAYFLLNPDIDK